MCYRLDIVEREKEREKREWGCGGTVGEKVRKIQRYREILKTLNKLARMNLGCCCFVQ